MFKHSDLTPLQLETIEGPKGRFYITPDGNKYPSITTVLSAQDKPWLTDWRNSLGEKKADKEMKRTASRGTAVHGMIEGFLKNDSNPTEGHNFEHIAEFNSVKLMLRKIDMILLQEAALYSDTMKIAGRVDCVGIYNKIPSIIDFKTSTTDKNESMIQDYLLQTTGYALMFHELYDIQIDQVVIIMSVERGAVPLVFKRPIHDYIAPLCGRINNYYARLGATK